MLRMVPVFGYSDLMMHANELAYAEEGTADDIVKCRQVHHTPHNIHSRTTQQHTAYTYIHTYVHATHRSSLNARRIDDKRLVDVC